MRIAFLGNHTVGVVVLKVLLQESDVVAVVAHPSDPEDGTRYRSVYNFAVEHDLSVLRARGKDEKLKQFIREKKPDLLWITDYRYLIPGNIISLAQLGAINLHPSLLPKYRGRAPINWAIINGEVNLGLTVHFVDDGMDTGDIIYQESFFLSQEQDVGDALNILYPLYGLITQKVLKAFESGNIPRHSQNHLASTVFSRRTPADGLIDFTDAAISVWNLIRAVSRPYPGAFSYLNDKKVFLWKARPSTIRVNTGAIPGSIQKVDSKGFHIQCGDGPLCITDFSFEGKKQNIIVKTVLSVK
jgi:methionyl-tRNA formyltransferase